MRPIDRILDRLEHVRRSGYGWTALCPAHEDSENSLSVGEGDDGRVLLHCHAGCPVDKVVAAIGLTMRDLFSDSDGLSRYQGNAGRPTGSPPSSGVTLEQYAELKKLPRDFLQQLGLRTVRKNGRACVAIPYYDASGKLVATRYRTGDRFWWPSGTRPMPYGLDRLAKAKDKSVLIVEGESDAHTAWFHRIDAVGIPGADMWRPEYARHFQDREVLVWRESDDGGRKFVAAINASMPGARVIDTPPGVKDLSELHLQNPDRARFQKVFEALVASAKPMSKQEMQAASSPALSATARGDRLVLTHVGDLLAEPEETVTWPVEGLLPSAGVSVLAGKPKAGKSTLARHLAVAVAKGDDWLGRKTQQGTVFYLALEDKRAELRRRFHALGATADDPLYFFTGRAPSDAVRQLLERAQEQRPVLIVVDTLQRLVRVRDLNDYAEVTMALDAILHLARETGAHVVLVHHAGKSERDFLGDAVLGSTAIVGSVDTAIIVKRREDYRTVASVQRYGEDLPESLVELEPETGRTRVAGTRRERVLAETKEAILQYLEQTGAVDESTAVDEPTVRESVEGSNAKKAEALRKLVEEDRVKRTGEGKRGDPYRYFGAKGTSKETPDDACASSPADSRTLVPGTMGGRAGRETEIAESPSGVNEHSRPRDPALSRESGDEHPNPGNGSQSFEDGWNLPPEDEQTNPPSVTEGNPQPDRPCPACGCRLYWRNRQGTWSCVKCAPPPAPGDVVELAEVWP